jgi:hypothetical protein
MLTDDYIFSVVVLQGQWLEIGFLKKVYAYIILRPVNISAVTMATLVELEHSI